MHTNVQGSESRMFICDQSVSGPDVGENGNVTALNKTRVPFAHVFANSPCARFDGVHSRGPCQTFKKAAVSAHPVSSASHQSSLADGAEYQFMLRQGVGCRRPWAVCLLDGLQEHV